ncbi:MAG: GNAT family N-acetyltransferase [Deltaproteobacteria bacterium]|nr:GNAT family N-acetyltransferase [Deltaproteobacteria bacterium]
MGWRWSENVSGIPASDWDALLLRAARPSPFLSRHFLVPWAETFAASLPVRIGMFLRGGALAGLVFLYRRPGEDGWELLGGEAVSDSLDAVVAVGEEPAFWEAFLSVAGPLLADGSIRLPNLVEGSPALELLPALSASHGIRFTREETDRSPGLALPATFDAYLAALDGKSRHELRRKVRRAGEAIAGIAFRVTEAAGELERDFSSFVRLHRLSHPEKREFMDDRMAEFFRRTAREFLAAGWLRLAFLSGSSGDIAAAYQIEHNGNLMLYNSGFDPAYRAASPGLILVARCIEDAIARGLRGYDFLRGTERYKYDLGGTDRIVYRATLGRP